MTEDKESAVKQFAEKQDVDEETAKKLVNLREETQRGDRLDENTPTDGQQ